MGTTATKSGIVSQLRSRIAHHAPNSKKMTAWGSKTKKRLPVRLQAFVPSLNFILCHYIYLVSMTIIGSILLYPPGLIPYVDAIFFAAGSSTQSGLNTINLNAIYTYQQIVLYLLACLTNPIVINTAVVFIRLHWFEKRFQGIVRDAQTLRRSRSRSRSMSMTETKDADLGTLEKGVNGRPITVLHDTTKPNGMSLTSNKSGSDGDDEKRAMAVLDKATGGEQSKGSDMGTGPHFLGQSPLLRRDITFADELEKPQKDSTDSSTGSEPKADQHIAFLERQRNRDRGTLHIPGPRDFERGHLPTELDRANSHHSENADSAPPSRHRRTDSNASIHAADLEARRELVFDESTQNPGRRSESEYSHARTHQSEPGRFNPLHPFSKIAHASALSLPRTLNSIRARTRTFGSLHGQDPDQKDMPYLSWQPTIGRNSLFVGLTEEQREELGGIEYRSLKTLATILVCYFFGFHLLGVIVFIPWIKLNDTYGSIVDADGVGRAWWGIFSPATLFNDLGFTLTPDSFISFNTAVMPMLFGSFLIVIGNTGFPCMLRLIIWIVSKLVPTGSGLWEELRFLLDHPRRCFTLLFPARATWILFGILIILNGIDLVFFVILDLHDDTVTSLPAAFQFLDGLFQAVSTRTSGTACVNIANLHPAIQVSYLIMMYISVFPIAISVRRTNVYEENSLGMYGGDEGSSTEGSSYVGHHLRRQLSFDLWFIFLGLFIITIAEGTKLQNNEFSIFGILFEIVSAYGTVGLSLGFPTNDMSLSAEFSVLSKLVVAAMMLRGRHRGLPYALDRAILLPSEKLNHKEKIASDKFGRRNSIATNEIDTQATTPVERQRSQAWPASNTFAGRVPEPQGSPTGIRMRTRRGSEPTTRRRSFSHVLIGGLSAGPTVKRD